MRSERALYPAANAEGEAKVSRNADKGDTRRMLRVLSRLLREQDHARRRMVE